MVLINHMFEGLHEHNIPIIWTQDSSSQLATRPSATTSTGSAKRAAFLLNDAPQGTPSPSRWTSRSTRRAHAQTRQLGHWRAAGHRPRGGASSPTGSGELLSSGDWTNNLQMLWSIRLLKLTAEDVWSIWVINMCQEMGDEDDGHLSTKRGTGKKDSVKATKIKSTKKGSN